MQVDQGLSERTAPLSHCQSAMLRADCQLGLVGGKLSPFEGAKSVEVLFRRKCLSEAAFLVAFLERIGFSLTPGLLKLRCEVDLRATGDLAKAALVSPSSAIMFCLPIVHGVRAGRISSSVRDNFVDLLTGPFVRGLDLPVYRRLEVAFALSQISVDVRDYLAQVMPGSLACYPLCPFTSPRDNVYALTHTLIYGVLLGLPMDLESRLLEIEVLLLRCVGTSDWDLCGELICAAWLLGPGPKDIVGWAQCVLSESQCLPDQARVSDPVVRAFVAEVPEEENWASNFHLAVTITMALASRESPSILDRVDQSGGSYRILSAALGALYRLDPRQAYGLARSIDVSSLAPKLAEMQREIEHQSERLSLGLECEHLRRR